MWHSFFLLDSLASFPKSSPFPPHWHRALDHREHQTSLYETAKISHVCIASIEWIGFVVILRCPCERTRNILSFSFSVYLFHVLYMSIYGRTQWTCTSSCTNRPANRRKRSSWTWTERVVVVVLQLWLIINNSRGNICPYHIRLRVMPPTNAILMFFHTCMDNLNIMYVFVYANAI